MQRSRIEREGCDLILSDVESGRNPQRESYLELKRLITAGRVVQVVATELSRLGRDATESDAFVKLCDQHATVCCTLQEGVLTMATPEDLLLTRLRGSLSQGESMKISQRVLRSIQEGRRLGKPMRKPCWGYRLRADRLALEPDPDQFLTAQRFIAELKADGWRVRSTFKSLANSPLNSSRSVHGWLLNPTLRGGIGYRGAGQREYETIIWDRHPALLSHSEYDAFIQAKALNRKRWGANSTLVPRALTSLCACASCGNRLRYISGRRIPALKCTKEVCEQFYKSIRETVIIEYALAAIAEQAVARLVAAASTDEPVEALELRHQIEALERLHDPDLAPVIAEKQRRLEMVRAQPGIDADLLRKVSDPRWAALATYDEVRLMLQRLVTAIEITKQAPSAIRLRL